MIQRSQHRRGAFNGTRVMAALALLFSFGAFLMAGVVMLRTGPEEGGLKANFESFRAEAGKVFSEIRGRIAGGESADSGTARSEAASSGGESTEARSAVSEEDESGDEGLIEIDRIRERVDEIEDKVLSEDGSAEDTLDELKEDLARLKDFSKEDGQELLDKIADNLTSIRKSIAEDSAEAAKRLRALSEDLVRRSREQTDRVRTQPEDPASESEG